MKALRRLFRAGAVAGLLLAGIVPGVHAQTPSSDALREVEAAMRQEVAGRKGEPGPRGERASMAPMMLTQLHDALLRGEGSGRESALDQIASYFDSEAVRQAVEKLRGALHAEREARDKAAVAEVQTVLANAAKAVQSARTPVDLDGAITALDQLRGQDGYARGEDSILRATQTQVQHAFRFVTTWQTYLADSAAGDWSRAVQDLQNTSDSDTASLIPRSQVLARIDEAKKAVTSFPDVRCREIMSKTRSLDDLTAAIDAIIQLQSMNSHPESYNDLASSVRDQLIALRSAHQNFQAGTGADLNLRSAAPNSITNSRNNEEALRLVYPLRLQLMRLTFPRYLRVEELPKADESLDVYLDRMDALAVEKFDPRLMDRLHSLREQLDGTGNNSGNRAASALPLLITARNQEDAGQFIPAVITYERVLKTGGADVPARLVGTRLEAIKTAHPQDYAQGLEKFLSAPEQPTYPNYGGNQAFPGNFIYFPGATPSPKPK